MYTNVFLMILDMKKYCSKLSRPKIMLCNNIKLSIIGFICFEIFEEIGEEEFSVFEISTEDIKSSSQILDKNLPNISVVINNLLYQKDRLDLINFCLNKISNENLEIALNKIENLKSFV